MNSPSDCLQRLGFDSFTPEVEDVLKDHKQQQKVRVVYRVRGVLIMRAGSREKGRQDQGLWDDTGGASSETRGAVRAEPGQVCTTSATIK